MKQLRLIIDCFFILSNTYFEIQLYRKGVINLKKGVLISVLTICLIVGGFFVTRAMNQADDVALSDDFTISFINEDVETDEGFHYFESGNGKFSMWFPENFKINDRGAQYVSKEQYESFIANSNTYDHLRQSIVVFYEGERSAEDIEFALNDLLADSSYENEYQEDANETMVFLPWIFIC